MKDFPKLSDAKIQLSLTQPQMKLLMASMSYFIECVDTNASLEFKETSQLVQLLQQHAMKHYLFSLPYEIVDEPEKIKKSLYTLLEDHIQDAYFSKQFELQEKFKDEVNQIAKEIDPEIFNLQDGEKIELGKGDDLLTSTPAASQVA